MKLYFFAGFLFTLSSYALVAASVIALCLSSNPHWLRRSMFVLAITLLSASTIIAHAHAREWFIAYYSANAYELTTLQLRATGSSTAAYWVHVISPLVPQLFWFRRFRSRPGPALLIALAAVIPPTIDILIISRSP
jgi:hypothetical protein